MADDSSRSDLQVLIQRILDAKTDNIEQLAAIAGLTLAEDFAESDLSYTDLSGAHLIEADFRGSHFQGANLKGANLRGADLRGADLREAKLEGADLLTSAMPTSVTFSLAARISLVQILEVLT